ncbi:MAG: hypothetical protein EXS35_00120 [Pedosphaera sp.]|nr:hypothetical protein [Pedosphaera sp.]
MKKTVMAIVSSLYLSMILTNAQTSFTNKIDQPQTIRIARQLTIGMREEDAEKLLNRNNLKYPMRVGDSFGWGRFYTLVDGTSLYLNFESKQPDPPRWTNGVLRAAYIQSNGVNVVSITLTNAPKR